MLLKPNTLLLISAAIMTLVLSGCLSTDGQSSSSLCGATSLSLKPIKIDGGHHLYFNAEDFKILTSPSFEVNSITLYVDASSSHLKTNSELSFGINGISATRHDGSSKFDDDEEKRGEKFVDQDQFRGLRHLDIEKLRWNGGELIENAFKKIYDKKGQIKISVQGSDVHLNSAILVINGIDKSKCAKSSPTPAPKPTATPTPAPTPPPPAPSVSINSVLPGEALTNQTSITFAFSSDQAGVTFYCSLDNSADSACAPQTSYSSLSNGDHVFKVYAKNSSGGVSAVASHSWTIDSIPPIVEIQPIQSPSNQMNIAINFSSTSASSFNCSLDGAAMQSCSSPFNAYALTEGSHSFQAQAADAAGNLSVPARVDWVVDVTPPTTQIVSVDPIANPSSSTMKTINFAANESANFECALDNASFAPCGSPNQLSNLSEGSHSLEVRAIDAAGNVGLSTSTSWQIDLTPPQLSIGTVLPAIGRSNSSTYQVEFSASESSSFLCQFDNGAQFDCVSPLSGNFEVDGQHSLSILAVDQVGLQSAVAQIAWDIDRTAPEISFGSISPSAAQIISSSSLDVEIVSPSAVTLHALLNASDLGVVTSPFSINNLAEGSYHLAVYGIDEYGNQTQTISHDFIVDTTPPIVSVSSDFSNHQLTNKTINNFTFSSSEQVSYYCELDGAGYSSCVTPASASGLVDGDHIFKVYGVDLSGLPSNVVEVDWAIDTIPPVTSVVATQTLTNSYRFDLSSNEPGSTFVCSVDGAASGTCSSPLSLSFTPGPHNVSVFAVDAAGNKDPDGVSYNVNIRQPISTSVSGNGIVYTNSTVMSFTFSSNYSEATFTCSLDGAAAQPCTSPISYSGLADGSHSFLVKAVDSFGTADSRGASYNWTVDTISPVIVTQGSSASGSSITVNWTLNEPATGKVNWGSGFSTANVTAETGFSTSQSITIVGLSPNTTYSFQVSGHDRAGNTYQGARVQTRTRF